MNAANNNSPPDTFMEGSEESGTGLPPPRRSGRSRKPVASYDENQQAKAAERAAISKAMNEAPRKTAKQPSQANHSPSTIEATLAGSPTPDEPRRNPKRKAVPEAFDIPDDLLEKVLSPMGTEERGDWQSWIEVESDPAFFTVILRELGVHDVQVQELFSLDSLAHLPEPVYGLVFLYQYVHEEIEEEAEDNTHVWFANQTTANACATVALLNIVMNATNVELDTGLQAFKAETAELDPPLRGSMLTNNAAIRNAHNSFARRLDLLNADLVLENEVQNAKKANASKKSGKARSQSKKKGRASESSSDAAFHFIAYVPIEGKMWQLDGLQIYPHCLGAFEGDWTSSVIPYIETRMLQYETEQVSFNLLALCRNPLGAIRRELAQKIRCADVIREMSTDQEKVSVSWLNSNDPASRGEKLASCGLTTSDIQAVSAKEINDLLGKADGLRLTPAERDKLNEQLENQQQALLSDYAAQQASMEDDSGAATGRKKDYTRVIHEWTKRLVEHGVLQELQSEVEESAGFS